MKFTLKTCITIMACMASLSATAKDNGCLLQGKVAEDGVNQTVNYCALNKGMSDQDFKLHCQELLEAHRNGLNKAAANKISMKLEASCPANYKGSCEGALGKKWSLQYMADDSTLKDGSAELLCSSMDGKWKR